MTCLCGPYQVVHEPRDLHPRHSGLPKPGILFKDITPLLAEPHALLRRSIQRLAEHYAGRRWTPSRPPRRAASCSPRPMALHLDKPLIPLRKPGKLPYRTYSLQLRAGVRAGRAARAHRWRGGRLRVLLVDDLLATGGTMKPGCQSHREGRRRRGGLCVSGRTRLPQGADQLTPHEVFSLVQY